MLTRSCRNLMRSCSKYARYQFLLRSSATTSNVPDIEHKPTQIEKKFGKVEHIYQLTYMPCASWIAHIKIYLIPFFAISGIFIELSDECSDYDKMILYLTELYVWSQSIVLSIPVKNLIGHVYTNSKSDIILSYLDFWGNRIDEKFAPGDLYLQSRETGFFKFFTRNSFYVLLINRHNRRKFRISIKKGDVFDEETFERLLGDIPPTKYDYQ